MFSYQHALEELVACLNDTRPYAVVINNRILLALIQQVQLIKNARGNDSAYAFWAAQALAELAEIRFEGVLVSALVRHHFSKEVPFALPEPVLDTPFHGGKKTEVTGGVRLHAKHAEVVAAPHQQFVASSAEAAHACPFEPGCPFRSPPAPHKPCDCPAPVTQ